MSVTRDGVMLARRFGRHLRRQSALVAMILAALAALGAVLVKPASPVGQVLLVMVGILVSVVVLPDSPHRLWNVNADDLAATIPISKLYDASREVASAIGLQKQTPLSRNDVDVFWKSSLEGLTEVTGDLSRVVFDLDYRIKITPDGGRPPVVRTTISSRRCVPGAAEGMVWFSYCSSLDALLREFGEHGNGCIYRELIDRWPNESLDDWASRVSGYHVDLTVDGQDALHHPLTEISNPDWRVVRVPFDAGELAKRFVPLEMEVEFHADPGQRRFPVKFAAYYVLGATSVTFEVSDPGAIVSCDEYLASSTRAVGAKRTNFAASPGFRVRAPEQTVLPPGAGAVFYWENAPAASAVTTQSTAAQSAGPVV